MLFLKKIYISFVFFIIVLIFKMFLPWVICWCYLDFRTSIENWRKLKIFGIIEIFWAKFIDSWEFSCCHKDQLRLHCWIFNRKQKNSDLIRVLEVFLVRAKFMSGPKILVNCAHNQKLRVFQLSVWECLTFLVIRKYPVSGPINSSLRLTMAAWVVKAMNTWSFSSSAIFADLKEPKFDCWNNVCRRGKKHATQWITWLHWTLNRSNHCAKTRSQVRSVLAEKSAYITEQRTKNAQKWRFLATLTSWRLCSWAALTGFHNNTS